MEQFIKNITQKAGEDLFKYFKEEEDLVAVRKGSKEVVTKYDKIVDEMIVGEIEKEYPQHSILTEESGFKDKGSDYLWIVDSLDGSGNFANRNPLFSVCVALSYKGELLLGTTYAPVLNEFYYAKRGEGAFLNGEKISVRENDLESSYVVFCDGHEKDKKSLSQRLSRVFESVIDLRKIGSAGVETGWLASGRVDAFLMFQGDPWDLASGVLLVEEAGGMVTDLEGNPWRLERGDFVFSNGKNHNQIKKLI